MKNILENKIVKLMPIVKEGGMNPKGHDGEFMYSGTITRFVVPVNRNKGRMENPLTEDERVFLEKALDEDLNIHKKKDNYWKSFDITIRKDEKLMRDGYVLDLSDPIDYIRYKVLLIQAEVAPSWDERYDKGGYRFALVDHGEMMNATSELVDKKEEAYIFLSKIKKSRKKMSDFLRVFGKRTDGNSTVEFMKTEISKLIENPTTLNRLIDIINDNDYEMMLFINDAVDCGALILSNNKYMLPGGDYVNPNQPNLNGTIEKMGQLKKSTDEIYLTISTQIKESK